MRPARRCARGLSDSPLALVRAGAGRKPAKPRKELAAKDPAATQTAPSLQRGREPKTTEDEYYAGEFTDAELNCQANIPDYRRAVEELFFEHQDQLDEQTSGGISAVS